MGLLKSVIETAVTPHAVDRYLELLNPMVTWTECRAKVIRVERRTPHAVTITLRPTRQWSGFSAGQFVQLEVLIDGVRHSRSYSPANADSARNEIEFTIARHPGGMVSNHLNDSVAIGDVFSLSATPQGDFVLPQPHPSQVLLIAGGSGITPVLSMARSLVGNGYPGSLALLYYAQSPRTHAYARELDELNALPTVTARTVYTRTGAVDPRIARVGHVGEDHLAAVAPWFADPHAHTFACGPAALLDALTEIYTDYGVIDRLHSESFVPLTPTSRPEDATGTLTFSGVGIAAENTGESILAQAESAGLTPQSGCRRGICFSCTRVKTSGSTRDVITGEVDERPDQHIRICVSAPVGDVDIDL